MRFCFLCEVFVLFSNNKKGGGEGVYQIINLGPLTGRQFRTTSRGKSSRNCPDFNESRCAGCEPPSVLGDRGHLARIPAILQIHQARTWETLPGIFYRFEKQDEGGKLFLKPKGEASKPYYPKKSWVRMPVHNPSRVPHTLGPLLVQCPPYSMTTRTRARSFNYSLAPACTSRSVAVIAKELGS